MFPKLFSWHYENSPRLTFCIWSNKTVQTQDFFFIDTFCDFDVFFSYKFRFRWHLGVTNQRSFFSRRNGFLTFLVGFSGSGVNPNLAARFEVVVGHISTPLQNYPSLDPFPMGWIFPIVSLLMIKFIALLERFELLFLHWFPIPWVL